MEILPERRFGYEVLFNLSSGMLPRAWFLKIMAIEQFAPPGSYLYRFRLFPDKRVWAVVFGMN